MLLLNDCGNGWTKLWTQCSQENIGDFERKVHLYGFGESSINGNTHNFDFNMNLSTYDTICGYQTIKWNKCLRKFMYSWSPIIVQKLLIMVFMPFIVLIWKLFKYNVLPKLWNRCCYCMFCGVCGVISLCEGKT